RVNYTGNGVLTTFAYPFEIFLATDLQVYLDGVLKTLNTDYTVSGAGAPSGNGVTVLIVRVEPFTQASALPSNDKFPTSTVEAALDKLTMITQQLNEVDGRALKLALTSLFSNIQVDDPVIGQFLLWATGPRLTSSALASAGLLPDPVTVLHGGTGSTTAAGARTNLGAATQLTAQSVAYAATIQYDLATGDFFETTLTGPLTLGTPLHPVDGRRILIRLRQDATGGRTLAFGGVWRFGTQLLATDVVLSTAANKTDYLGAVYHSGDDKWDVIAFLKGF